MGSNLERLSASSNHFLYRWHISTRKTLWSGRLVGKGVRSGGFGGTRGCAARPTIKQTNKKKEDQTRFKPHLNIPSQEPSVPQLRLHLTARKRKTNILHIRSDLSALLLHVRTGVQCTCLRADELFFSTSAASIGLVKSLWRLLLQRCVPPALEG